MPLMITGRGPRVMNMMRAAVISGLTVLLLLALAPERASGFWDIPSALPPEEHGNILINRTSEHNGLKPATFSHWMHRMRHTCRVCHFELDFNMLVNSTEITEAANKAGRYCGASGCHDGKTAFGHEKPHCEKCHNGNRGAGKEKFAQLANFPKAKFGNGINWVQAMDRGLITPLNYLAIKPPADVVVIKPILLEAEWRGIPAAIFSHKAHSQWLDCNNCHPDIFNIKKKTTKHFSMSRILKREFCGVCHLTVAFPMNDCKHCHPDHPDLQE
jgi:c(7)-type cytochrome triheme protein